MNSRPSLLSAAGAAIEKLLVFLFAAGLLLQPSLSGEGAAMGLLLWYRHVVPVLLPFITAAGLARKTLLSSVSSPLPAAAAGMLCGTPAAAVLLDREVSGGRCPKETAQALLAFASLPSPMFLTGLAAGEFLGLTRPLRFLLAVWIPSLAGITVVCLRTSGTYAGGISVRPEVTEKISFGAVLEEVWLSACRTMLLICGYLMFFRILAAWLTASPLPEKFRAALILICEITAGCEGVAAAPFSQAAKEILCAAGCAFGGLSCLGQTAGCLKESGLSVRRYAAAKCVLAAACALTDAFLQTL